MTQSWSINVQENDERGLSQKISYRGEEATPHSAPLNPVPFPDLEDKFMQM